MSCSSLIAFADEEPVATEGAMDDPSLAHVIGVLNQDTLHIFGVVEQNQRVWPEMKAAHIASVCHIKKEG
jgi:hypothetical protein